MTPKQGKETTTRKEGYAVNEKEREKLQKKAEEIIANAPIKYNTIFRQLTTEPETLGNFLQNLQVIEGPWDAWFEKEFCKKCDQQECDHCKHEERNNPTKWLEQCGRLETDMYKGDTYE